MPNTAELVDEINRVYGKGTAQLVQVCHSVSQAVYCEFLFACCFVLVITEATSVPQIVTIEIAALCETIRLVAHIDEHTVGNTSCVHPCAWCYLLVLQLEKLTIEEQVKLMRSTNVLLGPHGPPARLSLPQQARVDLAAYTIASSLRKDRISRDDSFVCQELA